MCIIFMCMHIAHNTKVAYKNFDHISGAIDLAWS